MKTLLLDDHLLLRVLLDDEPASLREICLAHQDANEPLALAASESGAPVRIVLDENAA